MKISKYDVVYFILLFSYFRPDSLSGSFSTVWKYYQYFCVIVGGFYLITQLLRKKYPGVTTVILALYYVFLLISTMSNELNIKTDLIDLAKFTILIALSETLIRSNPRRFVSFVNRMLNVLILLNFLFLLIFPNGITSDIYRTPINFWASDNHLISLLISGFTFSYISYDVLSIVSRKSHLLMTFISSITLLIVWSGTALLAFSLLLFFVFLNEYTNGRAFNFKSYQVFFLNISLHIGIVVLRLQYLFTGIIVWILHKDLTFTNRTLLWDGAIRIISNDWLFGLGNPNAVGHTGWLTMSSWNSYQNQLVDIYFIAHNQFLEILVNGGIFSLALFLTSILWVLWNIDKIKSRKLRSQFNLIMTCFLVVMITEIVYPYPPYYLVLVLFSNTDKFLSQTNINKEK